VLSLLVGAGAGLAEGSCEPGAADIAAASASEGVVASATGLTVVRLRRVRVDLWIACIAEGEPLRLLAAWPGGVDK
jgi:hypothetical protein